MSGHNGWFVVSRSLVDPSHDLHPQRTGEVACKWAAWIDLIGLARWKDGGGLKRGQLAHSQRFLASRWNWNKKKVARFLADLEDQGRIKRLSHERPREPDRISICNYTTYQDSRPANVPTNVLSNDPTNDPKDEQEQQQEQVQYMGGGFPTPGNLQKNGSGNYRYPATFEKAWSAYPNRDGGNSKKSAYRAWRARATAGADPEELARAARAYADRMESEERAGTKYVKQAATFWGPDDHWREELEEVDTETPPDERPHWINRPDLYWIRDGKPVWKGDT